MPNREDILRITLLGQFRVESPEGDELTPRSQKAQGLLALLATDKTFRRSRTWLQDKLWSDRGPAQGASSLRQALSEIRRSFGRWADVLNADRRVVGLDPARVWVAVDEGAGPGRPEFLEGIDIRDREFEDWLAAMRVRAGEPDFTRCFTAAVKTQPAVGRPTKSLVLLSESEQPSSLRALEDRFVDAVSKSLREILALDLHLRMPSPAIPGMLIVTVRAFELPNGHLGLRCVLEDADTNRTLWSDSSECDSRASGLALSAGQLAQGHRLIQQIADALVGLPGGGDGTRDADLLSMAAVRKMFSMDHQALEAADRLLIEASGIEPRAVFDSWRVQLATIRFVERQGADKKELTEFSRALAARALAGDPTNSNVLCSVANARLILENNFVESGELARLSVQSNPGNPLAWWSLANARLYSGDTDRARRAARIAQRLAAGSSLRFWTDFLVSLVEAVSGRTDQAIRFAEISSALSPSFRPPLRYLAALYAGRDRMQDAARAAARLKALEPDFSIDRLIRDPDYPVSMMRNAGLIDPDRLSEVDS